MSDWPDVALPLDLSIDYSRGAERARRAAAYAEVRAEWQAENPDRTPVEHKVNQRAQANQDAADLLVPFWTAPAGYCRVCGQPCPTRRHRWHPECVAAYNAVASSGAFRGSVWERDHGVCAACPPGTPPQPRWNGSRCTACGTTTVAVTGRCWTCRDGGTLEPTGWDADHIIPLTDGGPNDLTNAQTLCLPHHRAKTAREATARAARRRTASTPDADQTILIP